MPDSQLAPIGLSTYSRLGHLRQTVEALQRNDLATESELFIFSDSPRPGDENKVQAVRYYLKTIDGFKAVHIFERKTNNRVANNRGGIRKLLNQSGKMIFIEEDIVTAPGFLRFMNDALAFYENDENIFSITGYCPPIKIPDHYRSDTFVLPRFCAWGSGIYQRTFEVLNRPISKEEFEGVKHRRIFDIAGNDVIPMVEKEVSGDLEAGDVRCMYHQLLYNKYTIYPRHSLVHNIGHDGSGEHCASSDIFYQEKLWEKSSEFHFCENPKMDEEIRKANFKFRRLGIKLKFILLAKHALNKLNKMTLMKSRTR